MNELSSQYDILKVIGHGGFSAVFKARRKAFPQQIVALKQLDYTITNENAKEYKDFKEEVAILKKMRHNNIVSIYGDVVLDNKPLLEMEYIHGETLEAILKREKYLPIEDVMDVIEQVASALSYCHHYHIPDEIADHTASALLKRNAIIHNDINPKNIIRTTNEDGSIRYVLVDFGLSFTDPDTVRHSKKEEGMAEYKSPEKWEGANVDTPSDIYGLGIVLYELLAGSVPFPVKDYNHAQEMVALEEKHKLALVPDVCKKRVATIQAKEYITPETCDVPVWLQMLVKKCLQKEPSRRFTNGRELLEYYYRALDEKTETTGESIHIVNIDPADTPNIGVGAYLEVLPNILTEAQHYFLKKEHTVIGRYDGVPGYSSADFALRTTDKFISKNHCQLTKKMVDNHQFAYYLSDVAPSKNGTFYNTDKNTTRLQQHIRVKLKDGDYFWIGNTKIVFHE